MSNSRPGKMRGTGGLLVATLLFATQLAGCGGGASASTESQNPGTEHPSLGSGAGTTPQPVNTEGRLLASNCFQCHGTLGTGGFENIRGSEAKEVREYMNKPARSDIMAAHAQGYTPAQLEKIIAYLQQ